ncbi:MAG: cyclic-di-AMP receptor [Clostridia bacterium]|nr:cyclic-di-AMP receptor [Clostridia bacterium]MBR3296192.1 cyclic-di-AMP receptor [Clostridia bacterium]
MKLIISIVQDEDASNLVSELMNERFSVTKLASTGGFLRSGNTTLLLGVDDERLEPALEIIKKVCVSRKQIEVFPSPAMGAMGMYTPYPVEVTVGGATVFVLDVEQFHKI